MEDRDSPVGRKDMDKETGGAQTPPESSPPEKLRWLILLTSLERGIFFSPPARKRSVC